MRVGAGVVGGFGRGSGELRARHRQARERGWCCHGGSNDMNEEEGATEMQWLVHDGAGVASPIVMHGCGCGRRGEEDAVASLLVQQR